MISMTQARILETVQVSYLRRLEDLVHALGAQGTLHEVSYGDGADKGGETRILSFLLGRPLLEDLGGHERLHRGNSQLETRQARKFGLSNDARR